MCFIDEYLTAHHYLYIIVRPCQEKRLKIFCDFFKNISKKVLTVAFVGCIIAEHKQKGCGQRCP